MVDVSDVTTCQNKHARVFCVCDVTDGRTDGQKSLVGTFWSWSHKTSNYVDLFVEFKFELMKNFNGQHCFVITSDMPIVPGQNYQSTIHFHFISNKQ